MIETFKEWLYLPDPGPLEAVLATVAANRVRDVRPGVARSSSARPVSARPRPDRRDHRARRRLPGRAPSPRPRCCPAPRDGTRQRARRAACCARSATSGSSPSRTSAPSCRMHHDARAGALAALREVYDGSWTRDSSASTAAAAPLGREGRARRRRHPRRSTSTTPCSPSSANASVFYRLDVGDGRPAGAAGRFRHQGQDARDARERCTTLFAGRSPRSASTTSPGSRAGRQTGSSR